MPNPIEKYRPNGAPETDVVLIYGELTREHIRKIIILRDQVSLTLASDYVRNLTKCHESDAKRINFYIEFVRSRLEDLGRLEE
jgi:hypothetical protein